MTCTSTRIKLHIMSLKLDYHFTPIFSNFAVFFWEGRICCYILTPSLVTFCTPHLTLMIIHWSCTGMKTTTSLTPPTQLLLLLLLLLITSDAVSTGKQSLWRLFICCCRKELHNSHCSQPSECVPQPGQSDRQGPKQTVRGRQCKLKWIFCSYIGTQHC